MPFAGGARRRTLRWRINWLSLVATLPHLSSETDKKLVSSVRYKRAAVTKETPGLRPRTRGSRHENGSQRRRRRPSASKENWIAKLAVSSGRLQILPGRAMANCDRMHRAGRGLRQSWLLRECAGEQREHEACGAIGRENTADDGVTIHHRHRLCFCPSVLQQ